MMVQAEGGGGGRWRRGFPAVIFIKLKGVILCKMVLRWKQAIVL